jgi:hypothetical protein
MGKLILKKFMIYSFFYFLLLFLKKLFGAQNLQASRAPKLSDPKLSYSVHTKVKLRGGKHWFHGARPDFRRPWFHIIFLANQYHCPGLPRK